MTKVPLIVNINYSEDTLFTFERHIKVGGYYSPPATLRSISLGVMSTKKSKTKISS